MACADNLQVQWGSQDHYEIVRKVGRGKYSEVWISCSSGIHNLLMHEQPVRFLKAQTSSTTKNVSSKSSNL